MRTVTVALVLVAFAVPAMAGLLGTRHNFTPTGPGLVSQPGGGRAGQPVGLCVFCHTSHNAKPTRGLWNQSLPPVTYKLYESSTLTAKLNQPTGSSRLCLSCHDGTLALGSLRVRPRQMTTSLGPLQGRFSLGTDLSDDHPISFVYDRGLASRKNDLADPAKLPDTVRLDDHGQLQCTTCHDAHEDKFGKFLVLDNREARLCTACHRKPGWQDSAHATSNATPSRGTKPWPHTSFGTVADNGCENCHRQHSGEHPEWLLLKATGSDGCLVCHRGGVAALDVGADLRKFSAHPVETTAGSHRAREDPLSMPQHVACEDCHEPHSVGSAAAGSGLGAAVIGLTNGIDSSGAPTAVARAEQEVCYKCHGLREESRFLLLRQDNETNARLQFSSGNASFHPVETIGRNPAIAGLEAGFTPSSVIRCTDCHNSPAAGSGGARGPHGSIYEPILAREYSFADPSVESFQSYALCYGCHNRTALLSDGGGFPHRLHVTESRASCAVCHDAHGSRTSPFLINFLMRGKDGNPVVERSSTGQLSFLSLGRSRGSCSLTCHGSDHVLTEYPRPITARPGPMENMP